MAKSRGATVVSKQPGEAVEAKTTSAVLMLVATAIMLPLIFPPFYCFFLAPVALVPLCVCVLRRPMRKRYLFFYYLAGVGFFLPNLYWLASITLPGYMLLALYLGLYFPLFAFGLHRLTVGLRMPATFAVPLAWTAVEYARCTFLEGGFPWFMLGNSFAQAPVLIQIADIFGVWGVTFLIGMMNGLVVDVLRLPLRKEGKFSPVLRRLITLTGGVVALTVIYGMYRLGEKTTTVGPRVAVIQEDIPQRVKDDPKTYGETFQKHVALTKQAAAMMPRPDLIAWPETMVPEPINRELLHYPEAGLTTEGKEFLERIRKCDAELQELSTSLGVHLLVGSAGLIPGDSGHNIRQNISVLYIPGVGQADEYYAKVHLVPFGEYIPFRGLPWVGKYMVNISPYGFDYSNTPGRVWTRFRMARSVSAATPEGGVARDTRIFTFGTPICFEDTMPEPARRMTAPGFASDGVARKTDFLINVSNDGWFLSAELDQRLQASQLRAVENRVPIARAVNTGNSGFVDSCGRIRKLVAIHTVGTAADDIPLDSRVTVFSKIGDLFPIFCGVLCVLGMGWTFVRPRR